MNEYDEAEFTENEIKDLNTLLQSMNDAHRRELGQFHRFMLSFENSGYAKEREKQVLVLLRKIYAIIIDHGARDDAVVNLDFEGTFDESNWPIQYSYDEEDDLAYQFMEQLRAYRDKYIAALGFVRGKDRDDAYDNTRGGTHPGKGLCGLGYLIHSLPEQVNLVSLNISNNCITCGDIIAASEAFKKGLPNLIELNMSHNRIGSAGADAVFATLLGDPHCKIQKLDLSHNIHISSRVSGYAYREGEIIDPGQTLIDVLKKKNRSLVELNLLKTGIKASIALVEIFLAHNLLPNSKFFNVLDYVEGHNHYLKVLKVGEPLAYGEDTRRKIKCALLSAINMNRDGPQSALATKLYWYFEERMNEEIFFGKDLDTKYAMQCLEFVGIHGDLFTLMKLVRNFQAQGSLFG